ncbi:MAG: PrgI family protein [Candidatus Spechtbacteria bacterium]|nr:PrgI family protein [Candidatus Spechtbacteria bacterium]
MPQQFQVPQFIEHESKLIGPFTLKQTLILGFTGAILFVLWFIVEKWLFFLLGLPLAVLTALVAFLKINGRPLIDFAAAFFSFFISPQLFIWQKKELALPKKQKRSRRQETETFEGQSIEVTKQEIRQLASKLDK